MTNKPKVSIVCITYNQEEYIRDALEGFVAQKTKFDFEIIVADDSSTDKTQSIIREYKKKYPNIFKLVLRKKNIGAIANSIDSLQTATGEYIALCEGDDYWTDPQKLQLQADFLDKHPDYALCFHPVKVTFEGSDKPDQIYPETGSGDFDLDRLIKGNFIQTNSVMYRRHGNYHDIPANLTPGDWYLHLYHAKQGKIGFIDKVMSVYRRHPGGMWWNSQADQHKLWTKYGIDHTRLFVEIKKLFKGNQPYQAIIDQSLYDMLGKLIETDVSQGTNLFEQAEKEFPEFIRPYITDRQMKVIDLTQENKQLKVKVDQDERTITKLETEIKNIKASRAWKLRNKAARILRKEVI